MFFRVRIVGDPISPDSRALPGRAIVPGDWETAFMYRPVVLAAALLVAGSALAQSEPEAGLFISPAGEPFRAPAGQPYPLGAWFAGADLDHDGALSTAEFDKDAQRFFAVLDRNHDGKVDNSETRFYESDVAPEIVRKIPLLSERAGAGHQSDPMKALPRSNNGPTRLRPPSEGAGFYALLNEPEPVTAADMDFNTIITPAEFSAAAKRRFARLDSNADFSLKLDELPTPPVVAMMQAEQGS
jgi:hypothetical protein